MYCKYMYNAKHVIGTVDRARLVNNNKAVSETGFKTGEIFID